MSEPTSVDAYANTREHLLDELVRVDLLLRRHLEAWWAARDGPTNEFPGLFVSDEEVDRSLLTGQEAVARVRGGHDGRDDDPQRRTGKTGDRLEGVTRLVRRRATHSIGTGVDLRLLSLAAEFDLSALELDAVLLALAPDLDPKYEAVYGYLRDDVTRTRPTVDLLARILTRSDVDRLSILDSYSRRSPLVREGVVRIEADQTIPSGVVRVQKRVVEYLLGSDAVAGAIDDVANVLEPGSMESGPTAESGPIRAGGGEGVPDDTYRSELEEIVRQVRESEQVRSLEWITGTLSASGSLRKATGDDGPAESDGSDASVSETSERHLLAAFIGPDERTAEAAISKVCADASVPVLRVDAQAVPHEDVDRTLATVRREARLQSAAIHVRGTDAIEPDRSPSSGSADDSNVSRPSADRFDRLERLVKGLDAFPGPVFLSGDASITATIQPRLERHDFTKVAFPRPDYGRRKALWKLVDNLPAEAGPARLAGTFRLTSGEIEDAVETARALSDDELTPAAVLEACRMHSRQDLEGLVKPVEPSYDWDDIVLPGDRLTHLREIAGAVRHRGTVFEEWGFANRFSLGDSITVLFTGKSGTGKTMTAEIVANDVGLPLYRIDLSSVLSKYIGETEKNLGRVFDAAEDSNTILFFDEADALFGKRTEIGDSRDRYANVEVDYLLQRMEEHDGCVILASNLQENIDEAFRRRINATVDFPLPDEAARREIWELIFPAETPTGEIDVEFLADFELSGGDIKNVALTASFLAAEGGSDVRMDHLVRALRREFQKSGKLYDLEAFGAYRGALE